MQPKLTKEEKYLLLKKAYELANDSLLEENKRLRSALEEIVTGKSVFTEWIDLCGEMVDIAKKALEE